MKALVWMLLAVAGTAFAQSAQDAQIDVSGQLIAPPCSARFPSTQQVELGKANLNQLLDDSVAVTNVPLIFDCKAGSRVSLKLSAGLGSADSQTLLTQRTGLGLRLGLLNKNTKADFSLGETGTWPVEDGPLELTLQVKPVPLGERPEAGSYSTTLLLQIIYR
ncbi:fimbrial protein [Pseudomonas gingeri]|uniref:fimbrial protein n=1 Tax=Pseudomonas gingeri TaxID=117681 RepID=UPI0015A09C52|nr:fimbrial protein [Pseudomonas gingeri]NWD74513.1 fimbrial protein [Pseudomonas gingeri]